MIPEIGLMIAAYIVTRMLDLLTKPTAGGQGWLTALQLIARVAAVGTILVAVIAAVDFALRGMTGISLPELSK